MKSAAQTFPDDMLDDTVQQVNHVLALPIGPTI
jgi:hypothetical protein